MSSAAERARSRVDEDQPAVSGSTREERQDWRVAYHEAGHAIAAALCGSQWTKATIEPAWGLLGFVACSDGFDHEANEAFFKWAGSYAQARGLLRDQDWPDPTDKACERQDLMENRLWSHVARVERSVGSSEDMKTVNSYFDDGRLATLETKDQWASELNLAWSQVCSLAARLVVERTIRPTWREPTADEYPYDEDPKYDRPAYDDTEFDYR